MYTFLHRTYHYIKQIVAPPFCVYCKVFLNEADVLCQTCMQHIKPVVSHTIAITKTKQMPVLAVGAYQDPLTLLILAKSGSQHVASVQLGRLVWNMSNVRNLQYDYIIPIPLHWTRYAWRGYNQAEEIARV